MNTAAVLCPFEWKTDGYSKYLARFMHKQMNNNGVYSWAGVYFIITIFMKTPNVWTFAFEPYQIAVIASSALSSKGVAPDLSFFSQFVTVHNKMKYSFI